MTFLKKLLAAGVLVSLTLPMAVHGAENPTYSKPITDKNKQEVGTFSCGKDTEEWAKEVVLKASSVSKNGTSLSDVKYTWENGGKSSEGSTLTVKTNGTYKASAQWTASSGLTAEAVEIPVANIDTTPPEILNIVKSSESWTKGSLTLTFECEDYQKSEAQKPESGEEKREKGSGLHPDGAYSFDNGKTWVKENSVTLDKNGTVEFAVRDALENVAKKTVTVDSIDRKEPTVRLSIADGGALYEGEGGSVTIIATASDSDSGLAENAYSWDGGMTWTNVNTLQTSQIGNYTVYVQDKAGNFVAASLNIEYAQRTSDHGGASGGSSSESGSGNSSSGSESSGGLIFGGGTGSGGSGNNAGTGVIAYGSSDAADGTGGRGPEITGESRESKTEKRETEKKQETKPTEKEEKESSKAPVVSKPGENTGGLKPWMLLLIGAIVLLLLILLLVIKRILSHRAATVEDGVEDAGHMEAVYRRVAEEERKVEAAMGAAVAAAMTEPEIEAAAEVPETEAAAEVEAEPEVEVEPEVEAEPETSEIPAAAVLEETAEVLETEAATEVEVEPEVEAEPETSEIPAAAAAVVLEEAAEVPETEAAAEVEAESEVEVEPEVEAESKTEEIPAAAGPEADKVVLEGEHSRLIYDPETGEYKLEFK
ncbi:hypothetical protein [Frisingicoccus sp.]|uniref:hypothetical protein n=1 Tax=Frisingicoccus sp. TaxID=1918627 RepID=UPI003AB668DC